MKLKKIVQSDFPLSLIQIIFRISLVDFLILLIIECLVPGFVTNWFNPIWFLILVVLSGTILTINPDT